MRGNSTGFVRLATLHGLIWGSFLNVVIYRVPREMSVVRPGSHCPACGKPVRAYDNVPVLSFLILRGKARCCGAKMSLRYPLVEILGGVASVAILELCVRVLPGDTTVVRAVCIYLADFAIAMALIAAAFIDLEHMLLPDSINLGGAILGVATASFRGLGVVDSLFGAIVGFVSIWLPFIFLYKVIRGRSGMGMGDAKLLLLAGAWFGWPGALWTLLAGATQGTVGAMVIWLLRGKIEEPESVKADIAELRKAAGGRRRSEGAPGGRSAGRSRQRRPGRRAHRVRPLPHSRVPRAAAVPDRARQSRARVPLPVRCPAAGITLWEELR